MRCGRCHLNGLCRKMRAATREHFRCASRLWIDHPASELAWLCGCKRLSDWLHNASLPKV